ncbi:WEB family protein-like protein, partial [Drosera capensis]
MILSVIVPESLIAYEPLRFRRFRAVAGDFDPVKGDIDIACLRMFNTMQMKERAKATGSPKVGVGEIDTRAPFQSVKDAVSLFDEGAFSGEKPAIRKAKPHSAERVLAKESQFHLAEKELSKLKERLRNAENTKAEALTELEKARQTVDDLTQKLKIIIESKEAAVQDTDAAKSQARELEEAKGDILGAVRGVHNHDLESAREQYSFSLSALNIAKQELVNIRQDFEASLELKIVAAKQAAEAETVMKIQTEKAHELSKEILETKKAVEQIRQASLEVQQEHAKIFAEKDMRRSSHKAQLQEFAEKLQETKKDFDPELAKNLEAQLAQATSEIGALQKEIEVAQASDVDSMRTIGSDVDGAKELLHKVPEEEIALKSLLESLKSELETLRKEHAELKEKEAETESI